MIRKILALAVLAALAACGNEAEVEELKSYVQHLHGFDAYNRQVHALILRFDDPTSDIGAADIAAARSMLDEYAAAVEAVPTPAASLLRNTHNLYVRSFGDARRLALDETGDAKRQAHSVAIGLRRLRTAIEDRVFPSLDVLLAREKLEGEQYDVGWPELD
ncbi:MAG: hypothetical protein HN712_18900 [Gemmatimonadetes bacterium]|jgi:hypothetical protein|nr:hypothetical protein [Gemmatimonadota bacterium]MBT6145246.1 hypothetical protein [Gemmatimonadota bacterium]MBT7862393.1 hypothetical protein [Gemmatimonadota bacterium]